MEKLTVIDSWKRSIETRYHGPTNYRGTRISARSGKQRIFIDRDCELDLFDNHAAAAIAFCKKMEWDGELTAGGTENGYVFVFTG